MVSESFRVDCCRRDDQFQIWPLRQQTVQISQQKINIQTALMSLVDDDGVIAAQKPVRSGFTQEDSIGHQLHERLWACGIRETDLIAHLLTSGGPQFATRLAATPWLDGKHAIFGKVTSGLDVVQTIGKVQTGMADRPADDVVMKSVTVSGEE